MSSKYIVPIGVLVAAILIIVGGYIMLNPQPPSQPAQPDTINNDSYIEPIERGYEDFMPKVKVREDALKQNANVPFKVGDKYQYKTTTRFTFEHVECKDEVSQREYNRRMEEYYRKITTDTEGGVIVRKDGEVGVSDRNITEPELPPGCERKNKTTTTTIVVEYNVEGTERVEGRECYIISAKQKHDVDIEEIKRRIREFMPTASEEEIERMARQQKAVMEQQNMTLYYDKDTGRIIKIITKMVGVETTLTKDFCDFVEALGSLAGTPSLTSRWMLALDENFRWTQTIDVKQMGQNYTMDIEYKVVGTEKVNNVKCFNVEITIKDKSQEPIGYIPIGSKANVWVDKEKRILIKAQAEREGLIIGETNLISEM